MGKKGEGGVKNLKKWVKSFMDGPILKCLAFSTMELQYNSSIQSTSTATQFTK